MTAKSAKVGVAGTLTGGLVVVLMMHPGDARNVSFVVLLVGAAICEAIMVK